jgi:hypothetical protein
MTEQAKDKQRTSKGLRKPAKICGQKPAEISGNLQKSAKICGQKAYKPIFKG